MEHNPHNIIPGDVVILDADKANSTYVKVVSMTPNQMYSRVYPAGINMDNVNGSDCWNVMTYRLTPKIN